MSPLTDLPTIAIPDDVKLDDFGVEFSIRTACGTVEIFAAYNDLFSCFGTPAALAAAGIINADWIVEDRRSWCVAFDETGPRVRVGGRGRPKGKYMSIDNFPCDAGEYRVRFALSRRQRDRIADLRRAFDERRQEQAVESERSPTGATRARGPAPVCHVEGNVIYWPGSGRVPAALPA